MVDSRTTLRYAIDLPARLEIGGTQLSARILNLSLGGVFVAGPPLPIGTRTRLHVKAPNVPELDLVCIARWTSGDGCGLQFDAAQPIDTAQLAAFIRAAQRATQRLPTDAHLAALAIEHGAEVCSADTDFGRFRGRRRANPLA